MERLCRSNAAGAPPSKTQRVLSPATGAVMGAPAVGFPGELPRFSARGSLTLTHLSGRSSSSISSRMLIPSAPAPAIGGQYSRRIAATQTP